MAGERRNLGLGVGAAIVAMGLGTAFGSVVLDRSDPATGPSEAALKKATSTKTPKNVIFLIGDGMGVQEITAARYYQGAKEPLTVDKLPFTGFDTTWSVKPGSGKLLPDYNPDSASTASMWATGRKTIDERISQGPSTAEDVPGKNLVTVLERYQERGQRVGNVTTAEVTDASPASLASHMSVRACQGPENMDNCPLETKQAGGLGSIAEQEADHELDVLLGGGQGRFEQTITGGPDVGKTVIESAQENGTRYVTDAASLDAVSGDEPVLGLFSTGTMALEWSGPAATTGKGNAPVACTEGQRPPEQPSLAAMTKKALELLKNRKGFFLQVEGASIDKQDHLANACGQIGETVAFNRAIRQALSFQRNNPRTLIVVSADHSMANQIVAEDSEGSTLPTGYSANLRTRDGQTLTLTYGTSGYGGPGSAPTASPPSQQHTGAVVPVWAKGPGAIKVLGTNDQTDLFKTLGG